MQGVHSVKRVLLSSPQQEDEEEFLAMAEASSALHQSWVQPPKNKADFAEFLVRSASPSRRTFLVRFSQTNQLAGVIELNSIRPSIDTTATIGCYVFEPMSRKGLMYEAMRSVIEYGFKMNITRIYAEILPDNNRSIDFFQKLGFLRREKLVYKLLVDGTFIQFERWFLKADRFFGRDSGSWASGG
jgi:RimJ/RimL family protein N-acetyltransferase